MKFNNDNSNKKKKIIILLFMVAVPKIFLKLKYYIKLWRLNFVLKSVSEDDCTTKLLLR